MLKVSILGVTGFTGQELLRLLLRHRFVEVTSILSRSQIGKKIKEIEPSFKNVDLEIGDINDPKNWQEADLVFLALPHGVSFSYAREILKSGKKIIDLGADFRLDSGEDYEKYYQKKTEQNLLDQAIYGLSEINKNKLKSYPIIANPGCYPTSILLALIPLLKENLISEENIIADSKSGVSGLGNKLSKRGSFSFINENFLAYSLDFHRHTREIEQELEKVAGKRIGINFTPHLMPLDRGMFSTIYCDLQAGVQREDLEECLEDFYREDIFIDILKDGSLANVKNVTGTNFCELAVFQNEANEKIIICSALDNLLKGASGQAVQNMNLIYDFPLDESLDSLAF